MNTQDYWQERAKQNAQRIYEYSDRKARLVTRWFGRAIRDMQREIDAFYRKYGETEGISPHAAKTTMIDRRALAMTMEEARRLAILYPNDQEIKRLLNRAYLTRAVSREEFLVMQLQALSTELYGKYANETGKSLTETFEECYYKGLFDYQQFIGFGSAFNRISTHQIQAAVETAWKGKNYSERIWGEQRKALARYLNRIVTTGFIEGKANGVMAAELQKAMSTDAYKSRRLIRTECAQVASRANLLAYEENGTKQFEFLATLDLLTSEVCREMDGKVFDAKDGRIGVNMPPLHPFCRSTTVPYIPDAEFDADDTRAARDETGETYRVPATMKYLEWRQKYIDEAGRSGILNGISTEPIQIVEAAIRAVPLVETAQISGQRALDLRAQAQNLLRYVADDESGTEAVLYLDMDMNEIRKYKGEIGRGSVRFMVLSRPHIILHNHPSGQAFSLEDVLAFLSSPEANTICAIGNDGAFYALYREEDYNASGFLKRCNQWKQQNPGIYSDPPEVTPEECVLKMKELLQDAKAFRFTFIERR